jgi:hypothetical protein
MSAAQQLRALLRAKAAYYERPRNPRNASDSLIRRVVLGVTRPTTLQHSVLRL